MQPASRWLAGLFFLGCLGLGYRVARQEAEIRQSELTWQTADKEKQRQILDLKHELGVAAAAKAKADKEIARLSRDSQLAAGSERANGNPRTIRIGDILREHPEYAALYAKQTRRNVLRMYGSALASLNLPPDQLSKLKDLLVERQMSTIDAQEAAEDAGFQPGSAGWQAAIKQASQDMDQQIGAALGPNGVSLWQQLQARAGFQNQVQNNYAPDFMDAGVPLNGNQAVGLVQVMADASYAGKDMSQRPQGYNAVDPSTGITPHDERILGEAASVLNPQQLQILKNDQILNAQQAAILRQYSSAGYSIRP